MAQETIDGLPIPKQWLIDLLKSVLKVDTEPTSISARAIDEGKGFISLIAELRFEWPKGIPSSVPRSLVLKVPNRAKMEAGLNSHVKENGEKIDLPFGEMLELVHNSECSLYKLFSLELPPGEKSPVTLGKIYAVESEECHTSEMRYILMENFVGRGRSPDFVKETLTEGQVRAIVKELAALQAYGVAHPEWNENQRFKSFDPDTWKSFPESVKAMRSAIRANYGDILTATDDEIDSICDFKEALELYKAYSDGRKPGVMCHGDLWSNNMIFELDVKSGQTTDKLLALIDWQVVHSGSPTEDLSRLISSSVSAPLRRKHLDEWLELFYRELLARLPKGVSAPYSFEELLASWKKSFAFSSAGFLMHVAIVIANPKSTEHATEEDKRNLVVRMQQNFEDCL